MKLPQLDSQFNLVLSTKPHFKLKLLITLLHALKELLETLLLLSLSSLLLI
jgi:hypothetical protein